MPLHPDEIVSLLGKAVLSSDEYQAIMDHFLPVCERFLFAKYSEAIAEGVFIPEDIAVDSLTTFILERRQQFSFYGAAYNYLMFMCRSKAIDTWRRRIRSREVAGEELENLDIPTPESLSVPDDGPDPELMRMAMEELAASNPDRHEVIRLRYVEDMDVPGICRHLGITRGNCDQRLSRARRDLQAHYRRLEAAHG